MPRINNYHKMFPPIRDKDGNILRKCRRCGADLPSRRSSFCSELCSDMALIETNPHGYSSIVYKHLGRDCFLCGKDTHTEGSEIHHIMPVKDGGTNKIENLVVLHHYCHQRTHKWIRMVNKILDEPVETNQEVFCFD